MHILYAINALHNILLIQRNNRVTRTLGNFCIGNDEMSFKTCNYKKVPIINGIMKVVNFKQ